MDDIKKIIVPVLGVMALIVFVGFIYGKNDNKIPFLTGPSTNEENYDTANIKIGNTTIKAVLANNEDLRKKGLGGKERLNEDEGMLFVFDEKDVIHSFWMKDMLIAIDILWIDDKKVVQIDKDIKPPQKDTPETDLARYTSKKPVDYVLEVNGGYSDKMGIKEGDTVEIPSL